MRHFLTIVEGQVPPPLYHGSKKEFPIGFILLPQSDGYIHAERDNDAHTMLEDLLEKYRPKGCIPRTEAVFLVSDPEEIDYAGGYADFVYLVDPEGPITRCNLTWYSELYLLCEHETLSAQEAVQQGRDWYPDWEEPEMQEYALNYWKAVPKDSSDLIEYLVPRAKIIKVV